MDEFTYKETDQVEFEITIPDNLFQKITQKGNNIPFTFSNSENVIIYAYSKTVKWLLDNKSINTTRIQSALETGFLDGFNDINKAYSEKYVIGENAIVENLKVIYSKYKAIREFEFHSINEFQMLFYGNACGITRCIETLAAVYPVDFKGFLHNFKNAIIVDNMIITKYWEDYKSILPNTHKPESFDKFKERFCLNTTCSRLLPTGKPPGDEYTAARKWMYEMLTQLKVIAQGNYTNFDSYTKSAFGVTYSKIRKQKKSDPI